MFNWLKKYVISKTIQHAESRYSIFVWMRQINERMLRIESGEIEGVVQERAELEAFFDSKLQKMEAAIGQVQAENEGLRYEIERIINRIEGKKEGGN